MEDSASNPEVGLLQSCGIYTSIGVKSRTCVRQLEMPAFALLRGCGCPNCAHAQRQQRQDRQHGCPRPQATSHRSQGKCRQPL